MESTTLLKTISIDFYYYLYYNTLSYIFIGFKPI